MPATGVASVACARARDAPPVTRSHPNRYGLDEQPRVRISDWATSLHGTGDPGWRRRQRRCTTNDRSPGGSYHQVVNSNIATTSAIVGSTPSKLSVPSLSELISCIPTSLLAIAKKAQERKDTRFFNLYRLIDENLLLECRAGYSQERRPPRPPRYSHKSTP